jgi:hypothetical protein
MAVEKLAGARVKRPYRPPFDMGGGRGKRGERGKAHRVAKRRRGQLEDDGDAEERTTSPVILRCCGCGSNEWTWSGEVQQRERGRGLACLLKTGHGARTLPRMKIVGAGGSEISAWPMSAWGRRLGVTALTCGTGQSAAENGSVRARQLRLWCWPGRPSKGKRGEGECERANKKTGQRAEMEGERESE